MISGLVRVFGRRLAVAGLVVLAGGMVAGCGEAFGTEMPVPVLVTLPVSTPQAGATATPVEVTPTPVPPTATATEPPPPTPVPQMEGIGATRLLWEWGEVAPPSALAATGNRLAAIVADGRFVWLDADTGRLEGSAFLWSGILEGDSWGEVYSDGSVAVVAVRETSINPGTGLADSRARVVVYGAEAKPMWALPQLDTPQHFYSAALASGPGIVIVGKWPYGFEDNSLATYELFSGQQIWEISEGEVGYQQIAHDGTRLYVLLNDITGGGVISYDLRTGEELWRWSDEAVKQPDRIVLHGNSLYVLTVDTTLALDPLSGEVQWSVDFKAAPEAGLAVRGGLIYLVPAPTIELGFRPGIVALGSGGGKLAWHALNGLLADPVAVGDEALWTVVRDFDSGEVWLSGLEPETGLERIRLLIGDDPAVLYQLVALGRRVYVLGDSLQAYGY